MRKKYLIILLTIIIVMITIYMFLSIPTVVLYINWKVQLPNPQKIDALYNYEFREGEDLEIWSYNKEKTEKIVNSGIFKIIDEQNKDFIMKKINNHYNILNDTEKILFNNNVDLESLLTEENYFFYSDKGHDNMTWVLLVLDYKNNDLYYINNIY